MVKVEVTVVDEDKKRHSVFTTLSGVKVEWGLQGFSNIRKFRDALNKNYVYTRRHRNIKLVQWFRKLGFIQKTIKIRRFPQNPPPMNICIPFYHQPADILANLTMEVPIPINPNQKNLNDFKKGRDTPIVPGWLIELNPQIYKDISHIKWCLRFVHYGCNIPASIKILHFIINHRLGIHIHEHDICRILKMIPHGNTQGLSFSHFMFGMANPTVAYEKMVFKQEVKKTDCDIWKVPRKSSTQECRERRRAQKEKHIKMSEKTEGKHEKEKKSLEPLKKEDEIKRKPPKEDIQKLEKSNSKENKLVGNPTSSNTFPGPGPHEHNKPSQTTEPKQKIKFRPRPGKKIKFKRPCTPWKSGDSDSESTEPEKDVKKEEKVDSKTSLKSKPKEDDDKKKIKSKVVSIKKSKIKQPEDENKLKIKPKSENNVKGKSDNVEVSEKLLPPEQSQEPEKSVPETDKSKKSKKVPKEKSFWSKMTSGWKKDTSDEEVEEIQEVVDEEKVERKHGRRKRSITTTIRLRLKQGNPSFTISIHGKNQKNQIKKSSTLRKKSTRKNISTTTPPPTESKPVKNSDSNKKKNNKKKNEKVGPCFDEVFANYGNMSPDKPTYGRRISDIGQATRLKELREDEEWKFEVRHTLNPKKYPLPPTPVKKVERKQKNPSTISTTTQESDTSKNTTYNKKRTSKDEPLTFGETPIGEKFKTIHGEILIKDNRTMIHGLPAQEFWDLKTRDRDKQVKIFKKLEKKRIEIEILKEKQELKKTTENSKSGGSKSGGTTGGAKTTKGPIKPDMTIPEFQPINKNELIQQQENYRSKKLATIQPWSSLIATIQLYSKHHGIKYKNAKTITKDTEIIISQSHRNFMTVWGSMPVECKDEFFTKYLKDKKKEMAIYLKAKDEETKRKQEEERVKKNKKGIFSLFHKNKDDEPLVEATEPIDESIMKKKHHHHHHHHHRNKNKKIDTNTNTSAPPVPTNSNNEDKKQDGDDGGNEKEVNDSGDNNSNDEVEVSKKFTQYDIMTPALRHKAVIQKYIQKRNELKAERIAQIKKYENEHKKVQEIEAKKKAIIRSGKKKEFAQKYPLLEEQRRIKKAQESSKRSLAKAAKLNREAELKIKKQQEIITPEIIPEEETQTTKNNKEQKSILKRTKIPMGGYLKDSSGYTYREKIFYTGLFIFQMYDSMKKFNKTYKMASVPNASNTVGIKNHIQNLDAGIRKKGFVEWDNMPPKKSNINPYEKSQAFVTTRYQKIAPNLRELNKYRSKTNMAQQHTIIEPVKSEDDTKIKKFKIKENRWMIKQCLQALSQNESDCVSKLPDIEYIIHMSDPAIDIMIELIQYPTVRRKVPNFNHDGVMRWIKVATTRLYQPFHLSKQLLQPNHLAPIKIGHHLRRIAKELQKNDWNHTLKLRDKIRRAFWCYLKVNRIPEGKIRDSFIYSFITYLPEKPTLGINCMNPNLF